MDFHPIFLGNLPVRKKTSVALSEKEEIAIGHYTLINYTL